MIVKFINECDFVNYKKPSIFIGFPYCSFKCGSNCQNLHLKESKNYEIDIKNIVKKYLYNDFTEAIVFGGLEPFDSFYELVDLVTLFRQFTQDDIVIYSGYTENELQEKIQILEKFNNIIIKFGRYDETQLENHFDNILGVNLISKNQYAKKIS